MAAFKSSDGCYIGFHSDRYVFSQLDPATWHNLGNPAFHLVESPVHQQLDEWLNDCDQEPELTFPPAKPEFRSFSINIAQVCNLACTYCGAHGGTYGDKVPMVNLDAVYKQIHWQLKLIQPGEGLQIRFIGGEPLLYPKIIQKIIRHTELSRAGSNKTVEYSVITNGTMINSEVSELLAQHNFLVTLSIDGDKKQNDRVRPTKKKGLSSTELTLNGLRHLQSVRSNLRGLHVNCVFGSHNMEIKKAFDFLEPFDFDSYNFSYAAEKDDDQISIQYVNALRSLAFELFRRDGLSTLCKIKPFKPIFIRLHQKMGTKNFCEAGKSLLQTNTNGKLFACNWFMDDKQESVGEGTNLIENKILNYKNNLIDQHNCHQCWAKNLCGGGCMFVNKTTQNDKHKKDLNFCFRTRQIAAICIDLYVGYFLEDQIEKTTLTATR